jgi:hypothetical protein
MGLSTMANNDGTDPPKKDEGSVNEMRWRARFEVAVQSEGDTIRIGIGALQTAVLINAGALVALLAFVGQLWNKDQGRLLVQSVMKSATPYMWGLFCSALAFVFAYFYQWATTRRARRGLEDLLVKDTYPILLRWERRVQLVAQTRLKAINRAAATIKESFETEFRTSGFPLPAFRSLFKSNASFSKKASIVQNTIGRAARVACVRDVCACSISNNTTGSPAISATGQRVAAAIGDAFIT